MSERETPCGALGELRFAPRPSKLGVAREYARQAAVAFGLDAESCDELVFAVNEAVTNAIRHGAPDEHGQISIHAFMDSDRLTLSVCDHGTFVGSAPRMLAESGRGFALMTRLTDAVQLSVGRGTTTVRLSKART